MFIGDVSWPKKQRVRHGGHTMAKPLLAGPHFRNESHGLALRSHKTDERFRILVIGRGRYAGLRSAQS